MMKSGFIVLFIFSLAIARANSILIPMDDAQSNQLKAYGLAYFILQKGHEVQWLLNYRGGSFLIDYKPELESECVVRGISSEVISAATVNSILLEIARPDVNMELVKLETAPKIAVYSIKNDLVQDETDAVITVLNYAEIPYVILYDELVKFDWLHLHHEDFTGQHGRFLRRESSVIESKLQEENAMRLGYSKVSKMKLDVAKKIKGFCAGGGYLFAMCSGAETFDIALAAEGVDIVESLFDGDDQEADAQSKLDFSKTLAFENFVLEPASSRRFSDINTGRQDFFEASNDYFTLFEFSAKWDIIPTMLTQDHEHVIKEFMGQTTAFNPYLTKPEAL